MSTPRDAALAVHRFGLGARPGEIADAAKDPRGFLMGQLDRPQDAMLSDDLPSSGEALRRFDAMRRDGQTRLEAFTRARRQRDEMAAHAPGPIPGMEGQMDTSPAGPEDKPRQVIVQPEMSARFERALATPSSFLERLVLFWSNHFAISMRKSGAVTAMAGAFEREVVRSHVLGRFEDMLLAAETHPAMILFLDNERSIGPNSRAGLNRNLSLNENLGREILELHTLGVDGGYTQADVTSFAAAITGWTIIPAKEPNGGFIFRPNAHEPGPKTILGKVYPQDGQDQGLAVLHDLALHPSTAHHIAVKLATHFVADDPPQSLVKALTETFLRTKGDLKAVYATLIAAPEPWAAPLTKLRSPADFVIATFRATGNPPPPQAIMGVIGTLGEPILQPQSPKGYPDDAPSWAAPDAIKARLDWANQLAARVGPKLDPPGLAQDVLGGLLSDETKTAIKRAESRPQALALLLMSPEFQRR